MQKKELLKRIEELEKTVALLQQKVTNIENELNPITYIATMPINELWYPATTGSDYTKAITAAD